jgi:glycine/D-amino acid oxidase-like deaminating enzyme
MPHIIVVGAGAFGGWTALSLLRRGAQVTLIDAWGAGNSRSSSGDETRLIRTMYDGNRLYITMAADALSLWREAEKSWACQVLYPIGVLYLFETEDQFATKSLPLMNERNVTVETLTPREASRRFAQIAFDNVRVAYFEPDAGVLRARVACELVRETLVRERGTYRQAHVRPGNVDGSRLRSIVSEDGAELQADRFVFACGPWLGRVFPDVIGDGIVPTRQEVFYFGTPAGDARFDWTSCPGWIDFGHGRWYGMPGNERRGFKVADDLTGPPTDPTTMDRVVSTESLRRARAFVARRFPALASQPIVESRVCQYEFSPEGDFLLDRHPDLSNVWLVGGGSGHGFKMGPALGAYVARLVLDGTAADSQFSYAHFAEGRARRSAGAPRLHV